jgi:hypothetical protein
VAPLTALAFVLSGATGSGLNAVASKSQCDPGYQPCCRVGNFSTPRSIASVISAFVALCRPTNPTEPSGMTPAVSIQLFAKDFLAT